MKSFHCSAGILSLLLLSLSVPLRAGGSLTFDQRVDGHRAIERVYYEHRIWPGENPGPKQPFEVMMPEAVLQAKAEDSLRMTAALRERYGVTITAADLQAEMDRMARETRDAATLKELFAALGNDPHRIAECLARPLLADRMLRERFAVDERFLGPVRAGAAAARAAVGRPENLRTAGDVQVEVHWLAEDLKGRPAEDRYPQGYRETPVDRAEWDVRTTRLLREWGAGDGSLKALAGKPWIGPIREEADRFSVTAILNASDDALWTLTASWMKPSFDSWWAGEAPRPAEAGPEESANYRLSSIPAPQSGDSWSDTSLGSNCPSGRYQHIAVWTGSELVVWGGVKGTAYYNDGGRYNPATNSWLATSIVANTPSGRAQHSGVWTGGEVLVWSGTNGTNDQDNGGRYDPVANTWVPIPSTGLPAVPPRHGHGATWTGVEMFVYGGYFGTQELGHGGNYYDHTGGVWTWYPVTSTGGPGARVDHTVTAIGATSTVWGGEYLNTGANWDPNDLSWYTMNTSGAPEGRSYHTALWGINPRPPFPYDMLLIWGGLTGGGLTNTGGIYMNGAWTATSTGANVPSARDMHTAVWDGGTNMLVWGGNAAGGKTNTGGVYNLAGWTSMTTTGAPAARSHHTAVRANNRMIVWGGLSATSDPINSGGVYFYCDTPVAPSVTVTDPAKCSLTGLSISWDSAAVYWGDYDENIASRTIDVLRDGTPVATGLLWNSTVHTDTTAVSGGNYRYQVRVNNACGVSATGALADPVREYPMNPILTANNTGMDLEGCNDSGVTVYWPRDAEDWGDGGTGTRNYMVYRDSTFIGSVLPYLTTDYTDTTGTNAQMYLYRVRYINGCGASYYTFTTGVSIEDNIGGPPTGLTNNTAADLDLCADTGVRITWARDPADWHDSGGTPRYYSVSRDGVPIAFLLAYGTTSYTDTTGVNGTGYSYAVEYLNMCGATAATAGVSAADNIPAVPSGLANNGAADLSPCDDTGVQITWAADPGVWGDNNSGTRTYDVLRGGTPIASGIAYNTTTYTDTEGNNGTSYSYAVRYNNGCGLNASTAGVSAADNVQAVPSGLTNNAAADLSTCGDTGVQITWAADPGGWGDNTSGTRTYDVLRDGVAIASGVAYNTTSFLDTTGVNGTSYIYTVRYNNGCGLSAATSGSPATDLAPSAPSSLSNNTAADLSVCDDTGVQITWAADPGAWGDNTIGARTYTVLREGAPIASGLAYGTTTFTDTTGADGTSYSYTVRYINGCGLDAVTTGAAASDIINPTMLVDAAFTPATPGWGIDHFASIQSGINAACPGAAVTVAAGTYAESVMLGKACTVSLSGRVTILGSLSLNAGTWTSTDSVLTLTGDFANNGAAFNANGGTVLMGGTADHTLGGSASTTFSSLFLNDSLQGYWRLDDGSGTSAGDGSGNGLNGALNGPAWSPTVAPVLFLDSGSLSFDGGNDGVAAPLATTSVDNFTMSIWARWSGGLGSSQMIFYNGTPGANGYGIYIEAGNGYKVCVARGGVGPVYTTSVLPTDGTWKNLILVRDNGTLALYMNGVLLPFGFGGPGAEVPIVPTAGTYLGNNAALTLPFNGLLDDARIYSRALSAPEILALGTGHIPLGYASVTTLGHALDVDGTLRLNSGRLDAGPGNHPVNVGKNWAHWGGDFLPRGGTVTLDGSTAQIVLGEPVFNHFIVNPGSAVTLPVGTMAVAGDFTNNGTVNANGGTVSFNGPWTQTLTGDTALANVIIGAAATLATADDVTVGGTLTNNGWTQEIKAISTTGPKAFGLAAVTINTTTQGSLSSLQVKRRDQNHFNATSNEQTGRYWIITPTGNGYAADLTLPQNDVSGDPRACRFSAGLWDCVAAGHTATTVTRAGVTAFSDWAVGKGDTVPPPAPVGDGRSSTIPAKFTKNASTPTQIDVTYDATHCPGQKAVIPSGTIGFYSGYSNCAQSDAGNGGTATIDAEFLDNVWFNIVWTSDTIAGHPGYGWSGGSSVERTWTIAPFCGVWLDSHASPTCP